METFLDKGIINKWFAIPAGFNECQTAKSCKECIILNPKCSWCNVLEYRDAKTKFRYKKCDTVDNHKNQQCSDIHNPESEANITRDAELKDNVRVSPQEIRIKLRPGEIFGLVFGPGSGAPHDGVGLCTQDILTKLHRSTPDLRLIKLFFICYLERYVRSLVYFLFTFRLVQEHVQK